MRTFQTASLSHHHDEPLSHREDKLLLYDNEFADFKSSAAQLNDAHLNILLHCLSPETVPAIYPPLYVGCDLMKRSVAFFFFLFHQM